jgi:type III secretory pathway component EscV
MATPVQPAPITVRLDPALVAAVAASQPAIEARIEAELAELLRDLGVAARPQVRLEGHDTAEGLRRITVLAGGRACRFPSAMVAEAIAYVDGVPRVEEDPEVAAAAFAGVAERIGNVLACVCRAALSAQPELLVPGEPRMQAAIALGMPIDGEQDGTVEQYIAARAPETVDVHVEPEYLARLIADGPDNDLFTFLRDGLFVELGVQAPPFHLVADPLLEPGGFAFRINAVRTPPRIGLPTDTILVNETADRLAKSGVDATPTLNPATWQPAALTERLQQSAVEATGCTTWDAWGFLILCLAAALRQSAHRLMTRDVARQMLEKLGMAFPVIEAAATAQLAEDDLVQVLRNLLLDGVSVRNLRRILELLLEYETGVDPPHGLDRVSFVRAGLADAIAHKVSRGTGTVVVYLLDPEIERAIAAAEPDTELAERFSEAVRTEVAMLPRTALTPAVLTESSARARVRELLRHEFPYMTVLAHGELPAQYNVQPVARILLV